MNTIEIIEKILKEEYLTPENRMALNTVITDVKKYDSLVGELHKHCIMNDDNYENTELYKEADKMMAYFDGNPQGD